MKNTIEVPREWIERLIERADAIENEGIISQSDISNLLGYIESAKNLLEVNKQK